MASELSPNTDWQNENRESVLQKAARRMVVYAADHGVLSSAFSNLGLLATNGATLGACIVSI